YRTDRRVLMAVVNAVQALVITALAAAILAGAAGLALIYAAAFVTGLGSALRGSAASAAVPQLVPPECLDQANGHGIASQIAGNGLAGPAAGGWLFGVAAVLPFAVNAGALSLAVLVLLTLPGVVRPLPADHGPAAGSSSRLASVCRDVAEGFRWARRN